MPDDVVNILNVDRFPDVQSNQNVVLLNPVQSGRAVETHVGHSHSTTVSRSHQRAILHV